MKYKKIALLTLTLMFTSSVGAQALANDLKKTEANEINLKLMNKSLAITEGESKQITIDNNEKLTWETSDSNVATVDNKGLVLGKKEGTVTITAKLNNVEIAAWDVSVSSKVAPEIKGKKLVFEDNFNGDSLDKSKWNNWCVDLKNEGLFRYGSSPEVAVHPDNVYVKDGTLRLLATKQDTTFDGITSKYRSGMVQTRDKFESTYGYIEAMVKIPDVAGTNPAVWLMPQADKDGNGWNWGDKNNFGAEIDVLERPHPEGGKEYEGLKEKYWITMHYDNYTYENHKKYHTQPTLKNPYKWHKFAIEWTPEYINFLLDDKVVATQKEDVPNTPEIFLLSYGLGGWIGNIADKDLPAEMEVDYVRWYQDIK